MREIFGTICLVGTIQTILLFFVLIVKRHNHNANRFLSLFMFFTALDAFELYLGSRGYIISARPYQLSIIPYSFVFGPSVFFYSANLTARIHPFSKKYLLLYAPFAVLLAVNIIMLFKFENSQLPQAVLYTNMIINGGGLFFEAILYAASLRMIQKYIGSLKDYFSAIDALKLSLFRAALVVLILAVIFIFISLFRGGHIRHEYKLLDVIAILISLGLGFGIAFTAMIQPELFTRIRLMENAVPQDGPSSCPKYEKLRLPASEEERYVRKMRGYMTEKKPYRREDLTLRDLARELSLSTQHISMILNIHFKQNFYNFINSYRVEEVKQKLIHPDYKNHNILSIAYGAGFNSKSTFNTMFKKFTGKTPKEYRADLSIEKN